jgi:hypothetical protein
VERVESLPPRATKTGGRDAKPHRRMVEAMLRIFERAG